MSKNPIVTDKPYILQPSPRAAKKLQVIVPQLDGSYLAIVFGNTGYSDFLSHGSELRKFNYIRRHQSREDWTDINRAGTWSKYLFWNKPTLKESVADIEKTFGIKIEMRKNWSPPPENTRNYN